MVELLGERMRDSAPGESAARDFRIGIDFGGTKIEAIALADDGAVLSRRRVPNPGSYAAAIATVAELVAATEQAAAGRGSVGLGTPGSVSPATGVMRNSNSLYLNGRPLAEDLAAALGRPVRLANDANCLALSEASDGAAAGAASVFALVIGTGCGGGLVIDGALVEGAHGIAGEVGHSPLPWPTPEEAGVDACWCGQRGCLESWISGTGFARAYAAEHGEALAAPAIVAAARAGEPRGQEALDRYIDRLGRGLAMIVNLVDPAAIVLGGGMSNVGELYEHLPEVIRRHAFSDGWSGLIAPAQWGDSSGVRGAAWLWP
ncbi:ROK family protein [Sphingomonas morindae]|uniref:ROK family protein n=1 Tax=Sphingomonas morindae TaxID=1541170 RepID=A0ABY4X6C9_9SPHN|nr:ROK family protein [Sphingomonas morindae]USI72429.1 ROK family protein [Sphingomonas morindae]